MKDIDPENYYSPQTMATRMFVLDLQCENLKIMVESIFRQQIGIEAQIADLQGQIRRLEKQGSES